MPKKKQKGPFPRLFGVGFVFGVCGLGGMRFVTGGMVFVCGTCSIRVG